MTTFSAAIAHYRTTVAGVLAIAGGIGTFAAAWLTTGVPPAEAWGALGTALTIGGGLIHAADAKSTPPKAS